MPVLTSCRCCAGQAWGPEPMTGERNRPGDIELAGLEAVDHFGQHVFVRFDHRMEPLSVQWYRSIRLLLLTSFHV